MTPTKTQPQEHPEEVRASWDRIARGYDEIVTPSHMALSEEGLRRAGLRRDMSFLDVAAGSGSLSIPAARLGARVLSTDLSPSMLDRLAARARNEGLEVETRAMDGHALELDDNTFDLAGSQFGVMLFPDMPRGLREMVRVTKPGGRVLMIVFGSLAKAEFFGFFLAGVQSVLPHFTGPDSPPLPFQLQDAGKFRQELAEAGLQDISVETVTEELPFESGEQLWNWLTSSNPVVETILSGLNLTAEQRDTAQQTLDRKIRERRVAGGPAVLTNLVHIGIGTK